MCGVTASRPLVSRQLAFDGGLDGAGGAAAAAELERPGAALACGDTGAGGGGGALDLGGREVAPLLQHLDLARVERQLIDSLIETRIRTAPESSSLPTMVPRSRGCSSSTGSLGAVPCTRSSHAQLVRRGGRAARGRPRDRASRRRSASRVEPWICLRTGKWVIPGCAGGARSPASGSD